MNTLLQTGIDGELKKGSLSAKDGELEVGPMTPLQARKLLLVTSADIQRDELLMQASGVIRSMRGLVGQIPGRTNSSGGWISVLAVAWTAYTAVRSGKRAEGTESGGRPWVSRLFSMGKAAASIWLAMKAR